MNRHTQSYGVRHYFGDDLIELQGEPLKAIDAIFQQYGPCVVQGCNVTSGTAGKYNISAGVVAIGGADHPVMVMPFAGATDVSLPVYMTSGVETRTRAYDDGNVKPIAYNYSARLTATKPAGACIEVKGTAVPRFVDVIQDATHRFITDVDRIGWNRIGTTMASDSTKGLMSIADKVKLDGVAVGANKYVHPNDAAARHVSDTEKRTWNEKAPNTTVTTFANGLMSADDKVKLNGVADGANKYVHPTDNNSLHMTLAEREKLNGVAEGANKYVHPNDASTRHVSDTEKQTWNNKATTAPVTIAINGLMSADDKVKLNGVADGANKYVHPTDNNSLHMTLAEREKLNGVAEGANKYVHPNDTTSRHVSDTEKQTWNNKATTTPVTITANGLMSAADKVKLNGVADGANKYVHPNDTTSRHVSDTEKQTWNNKATTTPVTITANGLMSAADKVKLNGVADGANKYVHPTDNNSLHMTLTERTKLDLVDTNVKIPIAGRVAAPDSVGPIPSSKLTKIKGDFSAEMLSLGGSGINVYYRVTHNLNSKSYYPMINVQSGDPALADVIIKSIDTNYFDVILTMPQSGGSLDAAGVYHPFYFTIIRF